LAFVVFDVDGTLVDSRATIVACAREAFRVAGLEPPAEEAIRRIVGLSLEPAIAELLGEPDPVLARRIAACYRDAYLGLAAAGHVDPLFAGARELLEQLDADGHLLGVASGKSLAGVRRVLAAHGLEHLFVTLQTADFHPSKPHPAMLEAAMAEAGAGPAETFLVGDTVFDIEMARHAGAHAVGVSWGNHPPEELEAAGALRVLDRFPELLELVPLR